jgi:hypothetical protein
MKYPIITTLLMTMTTITSATTPVAVRMLRPDVAASPLLTAQSRQLKMVLIRASATELRQLRKMPVDIVRVRPAETDRTPATKEDFLNTQFIVEAVVPAALLDKLKKLGFDLTEVP